LFGRLWPCSSAEDDLLTFARSRRICAPQAEDEGPPDIEVSLKSLMARPGFEAYFLFNDLGIPIKWSTTGFAENAPGSGVIIPKDVTHFAALMSDIVVKSQDTCDSLFTDKVSASRTNGRGGVVLTPPSPHVRS
jgi:hypothetical protein